MENKHGTDINQTIEYYEKNASAFIKSTIYVDVSELYRQFEELLTPGCRILDLGCGSGRDTKHFLESGFSVAALDPSLAMCEATRELTGVVPIRMKAEDMCFNEEFDAIWACASMLHVKTSDMESTLIRCIHAIKVKGIMYASWKYGNGERIEKGRLYSDFTEASIREILDKINSIKILSIWTTKDMRSDNTTRWLNVVFKKINDDLL